MEIRFDRRARPPARTRRAHIGAGRSSQGHDPRHRAAQARRAHDPQDSLDRPILHALSRRCSRRCDRVCRRYTRRSSSDSGVGQRVLTQLLTSAASRGLLAWEAPSGAASRRRAGSAICRRFGFRTCPRTAGRGPTKAIGAASPDIIRISISRSSRSTPPAISTPGSSRRSTARACLLDASRRAGDARLRLGLDVIVFARPTQSSVLGALERLRRPLSPCSPRTRACDGRRREATCSTSFQVLDFDNFWDPSSEGQGLRRKWRPG